jgi:hypothetical protein
MHRRAYVPLLEPRWTPTGESLPFALLKVSQIIYAAAMQGDVRLVSAPIASAPQPVEIVVEGGLHIRGGIMLSGGQRLSDYLDAAGAFLPETGAVLMKSGRPPQATNVVWGDIALNHDAVQAVWEASRGVSDAETRQAEANRTAAEGEISIAGGD